MVLSNGSDPGLFNAAAAAASALGAITGGAVADRFGYESVNVFAAAGALLSLLCVLPLRNAITGKDRVKSLGHAAE
jgi:predicted MFS family arabinose efflux permease